MDEWAKSHLGGRNLTVIIIVAFILLAGCWFAYCVRIRNVHDNGSGTQPIGQQLNEAGTNISNATSGIGQAENHAGNIEAGIGNAQESVDYLQGTAKTSAELIGQCKSIIDKVRSRGKADKVTN